MTENIKYEETKVSCWGSGGEVIFCPKKLYQLWPVCLLFPIKAVVMTKSPNYNIGKEEPIVSALFHYLFVPLSLKKIVYQFYCFNEKSIRAFLLGLDQAS